MTRYGTVSDLKITNSNPVNKNELYCVRVSFWVNADILTALIKGLSDEPIVKLLGKEVRDD